MKIKISKNTKIYIICPASVATAGPEVLHQLCFNLRNLKVNAYMCYYPLDCVNPIHQEYEVFGNNFVRNIEDKEENILIVPEIKYGLDFLKKYSNLQKIVWWLSVDNFYITKLFSEKRMVVFFLRVLNKITKILTKTPIFDFSQLAMKYYKNYNLNNDPLLKDVILNLAQSYYATEFLKEQRVDNIAYLSDYLNDDFLKNVFNIQEKKNIVAYNPLKGFNFTNEIIKKSKGIKFVPIKNMTRKEVAVFLKSVKVYIDFGNHPGKDHIPREAAILGCCVITGKRGSAAYFEDVSIPEKYKFEDKIENIPNIIKKINDCLDNYEQRVEDFYLYRQIIKAEKGKFINDLKNIFVNE